MQPLNLTAILSAWPVWAAGVLITALVMFRRPIYGFLERSRRLKVFGATVEASEVKQAQDVGPTSDALLKIEAAKTPTAGRTPRDAADDVLRGFPRSPYVTFREDQIKKALDDLGVSGDDRQAVRVLLALAATSVMAADFEHLYGIIWGSQIKILQALNNGLPAPPGRLIEIYEAAKAEWPSVFASSSSFEKYIDFLKRAELIQQQGDDFIITLKGRTFLVYITHEGKPTDRLY